MKTIEELVRAFKEASYRYKNSRTVLEQARAKVDEATTDCRVAGDELDKAQQELLAAAEKS